MGYGLLREYLNYTLTPISVKINITGGVAEWLKALLSKSSILSN